jgi:hypothetical protein
MIDMISEYVRLYREGLLSRPEVVHSFICHLVCGSCADEHILQAAKVLPPELYLDLHDRLLGITNNQSHWAPFFISSVPARIDEAAIQNACKKALQLLGPLP